MLSSARIPSLLCAFCAFCAGALFGFAEGVRAESSAPTGAEACLERPRPKRSMEQVVEIFSVEGDQLETSLVARLRWKRLADGRHAGLMRITDPAEVANMSVLVRERAPDALRREGARAAEIFLYLPELRRVRRVSPRQATTSLFGTAFSYEDFDRLRGRIDDSHIRMSGEKQIEGRAAYVVTAEPGAAPGSPYTKILSFIDRETCLPLRVEYFDETGKLAKVLTADPKHFERVKGVWVARSVSMRDPAEGVESRLEVRSIRIDEPLGDSQFAPASLAEGP